MKTKIECKDIRKIEVDDVVTGYFHNGDKGCCNFEVNVDNITQGDNITIEISGNYACFDCYGYTANDNSFKGTLTMNNSEFINEYTNVTTDGKSYVTFDGEIKIKPTANQYISVNCNYGDTYKEIINSLLDDINDEIDDGSDIIDKFTKFVLKESADKVIKEIKHIDGVDLDKDKYVNYVLDNIIDSDGELLDDKYKSIDTILIAKIYEKPDEFDKLINDGIVEVLASREDKYDVTAKVYFSDL